jgi:hypothetical protein
MASKTPFTDYANKILQNAQLLDEYLNKNGLPFPSLEDENSPLGLPQAPEVQMAKMGLQENLLDMHQLVSGPAELYSLVLVPVGTELEQNLLLTPSGIP